MFFLLTQFLYTFTVVWSPLVVIETGKEGVAH